MQIESALGILAGVAQLQQIEDRLDVGIEAVVALARERDVAVVQCRDGLLGVPVEFVERGDAILGWVLAVVTLVVEGCRVPLVVGRHDALPEGACGSRYDDRLS